MASFEAAASGGTPDGASSKYHRAREYSLRGGSGTEATEEAMHSVGRPRGPLLRALQRLAAPFSTPGSGRALNMRSGSFMVGRMAVNFSEETHVTKASAKDDDLIDFTPDQFLLPDFDITRIQLKPDPSFFSWGSFFKELLSQKTLPVEDLTSFSGDYDYPANTAMLDRSWEDVSAMVKYELALGRIENEMLRHGMKRLKGPGRSILRQLFYRQKVERDVLELKKRFGEMEKLFQKLEGSTAKDFEDLRQGFKELSLKTKQIIDDGLAAIKEASRKDQPATDAAFDELKAQLSSFENKELATFVNDVEKASKGGNVPLLDRLKWKKLLNYAGSASTLVVNIVRFICDQRPDPSPTLPGPAPPSPSPVQEEEQPPPSVPTTPAFYKSIGRQNKGLLHKDFALTLLSTTKMKVPFGSDNKSNVSVVVCTDNSKVACKVSYAGLFEDKARMTFTAGIRGVNPKAKHFYAFPFACGVNGYLNASVVCGAAPDLKLALTLGKHGLVAGGKVLLDPVTKRLKHHEVGLSYGPGALKVVDGDTLKLSLYEGCLSQVVAGGLELTYSRSKEEAAVCGAVAVRLGEDTVVKAKVDTTGAVTAAVRHRLTDDLVGGACVRVRLGEARFGFSVRSRMGEDD